MRKLVLALTGVFALAIAGSLSAQTALKGSRVAMRKQNSAAHDLDYTFLQTSRDVKRFVESGLLVPVKATSSLRLSEGVSFPYTRPAVKTFTQRLAGQYKSACGERLVVTSLTRPMSRQPWNASELSVHPAGMALDVRVSDQRGCRRWLESTLLSLEGRGVVEATREHFPAHYHIAVFPAAYQRYLKTVNGEPAKLASKPAATKPAPPTKIATTSQTAPPVASAQRPASHKVLTGESLWSIAKQHSVTVTALRSANDLRGSRIRAGQVLAIPRARSSEAD